jgi:hypothetical protein
MADEQRPAKKVVKRVVKKTVVRPSSSADHSTPVRYGRPATKAKVAARMKPASPRPRADIGAKVGVAGKVISSGSSRAASGVAGAAGSATRATGSFLARLHRAARSWRIPHLHPLLAAAITGIVVGLVSVGLGLAALAIFSEVRGVASGGGRWGSLTFVVVAFIAFALGELLLSAFGSTQARLTSFLGVVLTIVAILSLFLGLADTRWALVLVPLLGAVTYAVAHWLLDLAERSPTIPE